MLDDRGYPNDDFDTQAAAVWVDHPNVVSRYRHGHEMLHGNGDRRGKSKGAGNEERTESLRKAMVDFRAVFEQLSSHRRSWSSVDPARGVTSGDSGRRDGVRVAAIVPSPRGCSSVG